MVAGITRSIKQNLWSCCGNLDLKLWFEGHFVWEEYSPKRNIDHQLNAYVPHGCLWLDYSLSWNINISCLWLFEMSIQFFPSNLYQFLFSKTSINVNNVNQFKFSRRLLTLYSLCKGLVKHRTRKWLIYWLLFKMQFLLKSALLNEKEVSHSALQYP